MAGPLNRQQDLKQEVEALFGVLANLLGTERLVLRAGKLEALGLMRSNDLGDQVLALQRLVYDDPTIDEPPRPEHLPEAIKRLADQVAGLAARRTVEEKIEKRVAEKMQERQEEYLRELRLQVLKQEAPSADNAQTLKKYAELEKLERRSLASSALKSLRPRSLSEVVGQGPAIKALLAKLASPFPQHVILYGPPGVGKTTVARLVLEEARKLPYTPFTEESRFVEVDGATLRWDPREMANPLLGSVHDPIYQGARRELAESAVPEPKPGLVTEAHGGILFIDELGEMDPLLQAKLLKVMEDKRVRFDSAYYDPDDPHVPKYIKKLFEEGAPADFVLVGATTRDPSEISSALRSRCAEVFFDPLTPADVEAIVAHAARRLNATLDPSVPALIAHHTLEGRKATALLADAYSLALYRMSRSLDGLQADPGRGQERSSAPERGAERGQDRAQDLAQQRPPVHVTEADLLEVFRVGRVMPSTRVKAAGGGEVGRALGLGVSGFVGSVIEIEALAYPARREGNGTLRFNETAGSMARDSVFNAAALLRRLTGRDASEFDLHVNVVGGGRIDGPSAGAAILVALVSAVTGRPVPQDLAVTGEVSIQGKMKPVGGLHEKLYGASLSGVRKVLVPAENAGELPAAPLGVEVIPVGQVEELILHALGPTPGPRA